MKPRERRSFRFIAFLIVGFTVLMFGVGNAFASDLRVTEDDKVVFDAKSGLYWLKDLSQFNNMSYDEQVRAIAKLPGNWRMATLRDIKTLDAHPDSLIHSVFKALSVSKLGAQKVAIYNGRINCSDVGSGLHSMAYMSHDMDKNCTHSPLKYKGLSVTNGPFKGLGAWVVSDSPGIKTATNK